MRTLLVAPVLIALGVVSAGAGQLSTEPGQSTAVARDSDGTAAAATRATPSEISSEPAGMNLVIPAAAAREVATQATAAQPRQKSMAATVLLWLIVPGGGNFYAGDVTKGLIELGGTIGGIAIMATSFHEECEIIFRTTTCYDEVSAGQFWAGMGTASAFRIWGLITAINRVQDINSGKISPFQRFQIGIPTRKTPFKVVYTHTF